MGTLGLIVFILIVGVGQLYFSHKRRTFIDQIEKDRKEMAKALRKLNEVTHQ